MVQRFRGLFVVSIKRKVGIPTVKLTVSTDIAMPPVLVVNVNRIFCCKGVFDAIINLIGV